MSAALVGAAKQLIVVLQRYFRPFGHPPKMPEWLFVVNEARAVTCHGVVDSDTFAHLADSQPSDPYLREALDKILQLQETAESLKSVLKIIDENDASHSRFAYLIQRLLKMPWMKSRTATIVHVASGHEGPSAPDYFGYSFAEIDPGFLDQLRESIEEIPASADKPKKPRKNMPDNINVRDLCALLAKRKSHETEIDVARKFMRDDERKAQNLLRQARRYRHLYDR